jgi:uncharacterized protein YdaL
MNNVINTICGDNDEKEFEVSTIFSFDIDNNPMNAGYTALILTNAVISGLSISLNKNENAIYMTLKAIGKKNKILNFFGNLYNVSDMTEDLLYNVYGIMLHTKN